MPHKCTNCGRTFADGSKEMLSGCPNCGGNKFQFQPAGVSPDETEPSEPAATSTGSTANSSATSSSASSSGAVGRAASTVRDWVGSSEDQKPVHADREQQAEDSAAVSTADSEGSPAGSPREQPSEATAEQQESEHETEASAGEPGEDRAQASARSDVVTDDELPEPPATDEDGTVVEPEDDAQPSLEELREELNSQFESIKIVEPGQYELNLMELYERDEYIIALKENGRYVIQVSDSWAGSADS
ncbi:OapC/ArvC family zinc-ribbon domain-containing protein [Haladaptatus sp. NG-WS-4]